MVNDGFGDIEEEMVMLAPRSEKLKGAQLPLFGKAALAYRVYGNNGSRVLCERHLTEVRAKGEVWKLTGESFAAQLCDDCYPEET